MRVESALKSRLRSRRNSLASGAYTTRSSSNEGSSSSYETITELQIQESKYDPMQNIQTNPLPAPLIPLSNPLLNTTVTITSPFSTPNGISFLSLPTEIVTRIAYNLNLTEYSHLSRTCRFFYNHFQRELIHYLKNVYGLSVRTGSLGLYAYAAHLQYRAPRLLDRIFDEFFVDNSDTQSVSSEDSDEDSVTDNNSNDDSSAITKPSPIKNRHQDPNWPMYWSVLYSLDKQPNYLPPNMNPIECEVEDDDVSSGSSSPSPSHSSSCYEGDDQNALQPNQNFPSYKCATASYTGSENGPSPNPKVQFLEKYAARMNAKFASRNRGSGRMVGASSSQHSHSQSAHGHRYQDWHLADIRQKKTYRMLIMQNIRYGDVALLRFYLEKYGAPINGVVRMTAEEQVYLQNDRELSALLQKHGIRVVLAD